MDESDEGDRDPALKKSYEGLVNLKYVYFICITFYCLNSRLFRGTCFKPWAEQRMYEGVIVPEHSLRSYSQVKIDYPNVNLKYVQFLCDIL